MNELELKIGEMVATIRKLEEYHSDYVKNIDRFEVERETFSDLMNDLTNKFSIIIANQNESKDNYKEAMVLLTDLGKQVEKINEKDRQRIYIAGWIGSVLIGIGAFIYANIQPLIEFIIFYYHKQTDK